MTSTRDRLLDAALAAFATRGVDGTAITDLEADAGLAPGSGGFYRYFKTKDEVLAAAVEREMSRVEGEQRLTEPTEADVAAAPDGLAARFSTSLRTLAAHHHLIAILSRERHRIPALAVTLQARLHAVDMRDHDAKGSAGSAASLGAVTLSALVGYHLASEYFGTPPGGLDRDDFAAALAQVVTS